MSSQTIPQPAPSTSTTPTGSATVAQMPESLNSKLLKLNDSFCLVEQLPAIVTIPTLESISTNRNDLQVYSRAEFVNTICSNRFHLLPAPQSRRVNVGSEWTKWPGQRRVKSLTYAPGKPQFFADHLNTWIPSSIKPKKGDLSHWLSYLDHIFQSDPTHRDWFIAWLAYQFQHPGTKLHSAVVFWSTETSTGKSLFGYIMAELFGPHNFSEISEGDLHGSFNHWAARKQFVMGEEIRGKNAEKHADYLKSLITRKFVTINTKNTPHYVLPDCINYFFTSNHAEAFYLDRTDRRFFVHQLSNTKLDAHYVNSTFRPWLDAGGYSAILHWFLNDIDLSKPLSDGRPFNPFGPPPQTLARAAMVETSRDELDVWLEYLAQSPNGIFYGTPGWRLATAEDLHESFTLKYPKCRVAYKSFVTRLRQACPMVRGTNVVDVGDGPPKRLYCPPLALHSYAMATLTELQDAYQEGR